jgi:hypothetical protein
MPAGVSANRIIDHLSQNTETGIAFGNGSLIEIDLTNFQYTREKLRLINLRKPLFELLLSSVQQHNASNRIGFSPADDIYIQYALSNSEALAEYASALGMSTEFAKKELTLISDSAIKNNFRIFTVATRLKEKINSVHTVQDADAVRPLIKSAFDLAGMINV